MPLKRPSKKSLKTKKKDLKGIKKSSANPKRPLEAPRASKKSPEASVVKVSTPKPEDGKPRGRPRTKPKQLPREKRVLSQSTGSKSPAIDPGTTKRSSSGAALKFTPNPPKSSKPTSETSSKPLDTHQKPPGSASKTPGASLKSSGTPTKSSGGQPRISRETRGSVGSVSEEQRKSAPEAVPDNIEGRVKYSVELFSYGLICLSNM